MSKNIKSGHILVSAFILLILFVAVTGLWAMLITTKGPLKEDKMVQIAAGQSVGSMAQTLKENNVVSSEFLFKLSSKMMFADKNMQAGMYEFDAETPLRDVIKKLARGHTAQFKVTVPEGLRSYEVLDILKAQEFLTDKDKLPKITESDLLLPETYMFTYGESATSVLARMKDSMIKALDEVWENRADDLPIHSKEELLVLASIIEKETALDSERNEIAGVFVNRLKKGMKLQSDPTVIYGLTDYDGDITRKHLRTMHPHNTYVIKGLPPTPIAHAGLASLKAAANPAETENLFFVADMTGGHVFAKTNAEHEKNVEAYLKKYRELVSGGK